MDNLFKRKKTAVMAAESKIRPGHYALVSRYGCDGKPDVILSLSTACLHFRDKLAVGFLWTPTVPRSVSLCTDPAWASC